MAVQPDSGEAAIGICQPDLQRALASLGGSAPAEEAQVVEDFVFDP
jgi:hypothetical protein